MKENMLSCSVCGTKFSTQDQSLCAKCPLNVNCHEACCPTCGSHMVTTEHSVMARLFSRVFGAHKSSTSARAAMVKPHRTRMETSFTESSGQEASSRLDGIPSGHAALVLGYGGHLSEGIRRHLQAYGLLPENHIRVLANNSSVVIVQIENTELALEREVASQIYARAD